MSIVSSYFSSRSTAFGINAQFASLMDSIYAIGLGLGVRFVIDLASHRNVKLTGTLVGLWEGVVMQHFLRKMPSSFDPYVAYGVRLFIDFLFTESLSRMVLVLVWTGMGIILADITPALWVDVGMRRIWRRFRRDLYVMSRSVPSVPLFSRPRIVRFTPSREPSVVSTTPPSMITNTTLDPSRLAPPVSSRRRAVPGAFPDDISETGTEITFRGTPSEFSTSPGTTHHRFSSFSRRPVTVETETEVSSGFNDLDEGNISSSDSSCSTETMDPSAINPSEIPDYDEEAERVMSEKKTAEKGKKREDSDGEITPKRRAVVLPPTPSDSFALHHAHDMQDEVQPPPAEVPLIPDQSDDDWEKLDRREAEPTPPPITRDIPPTPPAKDNHSLLTPISPPRQQVLRPIIKQAPIPEIPQPQQTQDDGTNAVPATTDDTLIDLMNFGSEPPSTTQQQHIPDASSSQRPIDRISSGSLFDTRGNDTRTPPPPFQDHYEQQTTNLTRSSQHSPDPDPAAGSAPGPQTTAGDNVDNSVHLSEGEHNGEHNTVADDNVNNDNADNAATTAVGGDAAAQTTLDTDTPHGNNDEAQGREVQERNENAPPPSMNPEPEASGSAPDNNANTEYAEITNRPSSPSSTAAGSDLPEGSDSRAEQGDHRAEAAAQSCGVETVLQRTSAIEAAEKNLVKLNRKATRWLSAIPSAKEISSLNEIDVQGHPPQESANIVEEAMTKQALKNESTLSISLTKGNPGKNQKKSVVNLLKNHNLNFQDMADKRILIVNILSVDA